MLVWKRSETMNIYIYALRKVRVTGTACSYLGSYTTLVKIMHTSWCLFSWEKKPKGLSSFIKRLSPPFHDAMDSLRKSIRSNFYQAVAQRGVGFFMDFLENERFFKRDFSRLSGLIEPKMFDEENPPLVDPFALNSLKFL